MRFNKKPAVSFIFSAVFILLLSAVSINAQIIQWAQTYGGPGDDGGESMVLTSDGGIVIAGFKSSNNSKNVLIMKTDSSGNELWSRTYNLGLDDWGRSLKQTQDGGFIIAGMTEVNSQTFDPFLIKTDSAGNMQWQRQYDYGFGDDDRAHSVCQTSDGGFIIAGQTWLGYPFGSYDFYVVKTDMSGSVQWQRTYAYDSTASPGADVALSIQQLSDGGYIIGGFTQGNFWASYIIRTDSLGNAIWSNIYPGAWQSECYDIQATPDGGFILTGTETSYTTDGDLLIIKLDANGNLIWKKIYGTVDIEKGESIQRLQDGGYIIAGMSTHGAGGYDMYVVRTNSTGDSLWSRTIGGFGDDRAFSVASAQAGSYFVTGWSWSYGQGLGDVYLVKLLDSGVPVELMVAIENGWNMVSIPGLHPVDQNVNTWWAFRDMGANVFKYAGEYQPITAAAPGTGYWMKHTGDRTYNTGDEWPAGGILTVAHDPLAGASGWNLIGGYERSVTAANVTTNPPGLQSGPIYKYSGGYQIATTIDPGYGYWMKLTAAGQIIIPETLSKGTNPVEYFPENWGKIVLKDATGINYTLYAVKGETDLSQYELPPAPPAGMFDIRYSSGRIAENLNSAIKTIDMSGVTYPLTVRVERMDIRLMDETGKSINVNLKAGEDIVISDATVMKLMVSGELIPAQYALEQNYPNPFNPSTTIKYSLPEPGKISIKLYDILGNEIAVFEEGFKERGNYNISFNADLASGIYLYRLQHSKGIITKKMLILK